MAKQEKSQLLRDTIHTWRLILSYVPGSKVLFALQMLIQTCIGIAGNFNDGWLLKRITAAATSGDAAQIITGMFWYVLIAVLISAQIWLLNHIYIGNIKAQAEYTLRTRIFSRLLQAPLGADAQTHSGDQLARLVDDGSNVANALTWDTMRVAWPFVNLIGSCIITLVTSWQIGLVSIALGGAFLVVTRRIAGPMRQNSKAIREAQSSSTQSMLDFLSAIQSVRIMGLERPIVERFETSTRSARVLATKNVTLDAWQSTIGNLIGMMTSIIVFIVGIWLVNAGQLELPNLLFVYSFSVSVVYSLIGIGQSFTHFQSVAASSARVLTVLDSPPEEARTSFPPIDAYKKANSPMLEVENLRFRYREALAPALDGVSFRVAEGEHIALVGESGSGKSTIFRMLLGLYQPEDGQIRLYGNACKDASLASLRAQFAYVAQESPLFDGSIRENILMGRESAPEDEVHEAARTANADGFIRQFAKGYESEVGELGAKLSGGQRQRIAIARALLRNAPILLLDESTASLDSQNEDLVQQALDRFAEGRTTIVAAHRLSTVQNADRILVFDKGRIVQSGTHEALLKEGGIYAELVRAQEVLI